MGAFKSEPSGIGSSNAFAALAETQVPLVVLVKDVTTNSFSFALQNVTDEVPQRVLVPVDVLVLELVTDEAHDDVQLGVVDRVILDSDVTRSPVASSLSPHLVEHIDVQEVLIGDLPPPKHISTIGDSSAVPL